MGNECPDNNKDCYFLKDKEEITKQLQEVLKRMENVDCDVTLRNGTTKVVKQSEAIVLTWENQIELFKHIEQINQRTQILEDLHLLVEYSKKIGKILSPVFRILRIIGITGIIFLALYLLLAGRIRIEDIMSNIFGL